MLKKEETLVYATRVKDKDVLKRSSSGGMFTVLSDLILEQGGAVVCCVYDYEKHAALFQLITEKKKREAALGSKYMQSIIGDSFVASEKWIKNNPGKELLFIGMGCQVEGFRKFAELRGFLNRVYLVDIICHGSPSPQIWHEYADMIERKNNGKITYLTFKDKRKGWGAPTAIAKINGKEILIKDYVKVFYDRCALRPSCHVCPYACTERKIDMTIGDYWNIEEIMPDFYSKNGNSLILIHSERGGKLLEGIKESIEYRESNTLECLQPNLIEPTIASKLRKQFWRDYHEKGIAYIMKKYGTRSITQKIKSKLRKIFGGVNLYN